MQGPATILMLVPMLLHAGAARAGQTAAPIEGYSGNPGGATTWLAIAALAMILALWAVHWSIFRK